MLGFTFVARSSILTITTNTTGNANLIIKLRVAKIKEVIILNKRLILIVLLCVALTVPLFFSGCLGLGSSKPSTTTTTTTSATATLQARIESAEARLKALEAGVANLSEPEELANFETRIAALEAQASNPISQADINDLQAQIDALTDEIDALTEEPENGNSVPTNNEAIRWRFEQPAFYSKTGTYLSGLEGYLREDTRVKDEDIYYIALWVRATEEPDGIDERTQFYITLTLKPSSTSDYALLSDNTYLDTDDVVLVSGGTPERIPEPSWEADFQTKTREGVDVTRKVVFESSILTIDDLPFGNPSFSDNYIYIPLVLELYYAD